MEELQAKLDQAVALLGEVAQGVEAVAADAKEEIKAELLQAYQAQQASESASEQSIADLLAPKVVEE